MKDLEDIIKERLEANIGKEAYYLTHCTDEGYSYGIIEEGHRGPLIRDLTGYYKGCYDWYYRMVDVIIPNENK